jgi:hypothetical protein
MSDYQLKFDPSFAEALTELDEKDPEARYEWEAIVNELKVNALFKPESPPYIVEQDFVERICSCQHLSGWCNWALYWEYETHASLRKPVSSVTIFAERSAQIRLKPQP